MREMPVRVQSAQQKEDFADPPTLGTVEGAFKKIAHGTYVLTPYGKGCSNIWAT